MERLDTLIQKAEQSAIKQGAAKRARKQAGFTGHAGQAVIEPQPGEPPLIAPVVVKQGSIGGQYGRRQRSLLEANERRRKFARAFFFSGFDAKKAMAAAGYKPTTQIGRMLKEPVVIDELEQLARTAHQAIEAEAFDATRHWIEIAHSNIMDFLTQTEDGTLQVRAGLNDLPPDKQRQIKKIKVQRKIYTMKDETTEETITTEIELWDKVAALDAISKIEGLFKDKLADAVHDFAAVLAERLTKMERVTGRTFLQNGTEVHP